mmetsp:Transcript_5012/g.7236  ORF Transcript_5012/g.7236 Transcript_5012/m.7236 type:complete len:271 (+) Transcript_5012:184-996(+)|eukprot:CAMPEP_0184857702 /NCGR_PEP_ID=MMETSP0580-20130426/2848_1 /TAXON_ID=1118495 /ORGANISM="Dactyliosolen fragilissimus" /LENGTH=270 /DNA_ID=CAMNT_0027353443 /DNA_START=116 /DNA_END=928 /DNA_ORIENTATION=-
MLELTARTFSYVPPSLPDVDIENAKDEETFRNHQSSQRCSSSSQQEEGITEKERLGRKESIIFYSTITVASLSIVTGIVAMMIELSTVCYIAFAIPFLSAPLVIKQRYTIARMSSIRALIYKLECQTLRIEDENDYLVTNIKSLQTQIQRLKHVKNDLEDILLKQNVNIEDFNQLGKDHLALTKATKDLIRAQKFQSIITSLLTADRDKNFHMNREEVKMAKMAILHKQSEELKNSLGCSKPMANMITSSFQAWMKEEEEKEENSQPAIV